MAGRLFLVATPIGNLGDITQRARQTLADARFVACEDTRHSRVLLDHVGLGGKELVSLPAFAEGERAGRIIARIAGGEDCALITDAGTPGISDPGEKLVAAALDLGLEVIPIPGPSAVVTALCASGLPTGRFHFLGFLPRRGGDRRALLEEVCGLRATLVLYEAPGRVGETLSDLADALGGERRACLARELTKLHEEWVRGSLAELRERYRDQAPRGEVVLVVEGRTGAVRWTEAEVIAAVREGLAAGEGMKALSAEVSQRAGWAAKEVYRLGLGLKGQDGR